MFIEKLKSGVKFFVAAAIAAVVSGCAINWYTLPPDMQEAPVENISKEINTYQQRLKFRRRAYFVGQKVTRTWFTHFWFRSYVTTASFETAFTQQLGSELQNRFSNMRDLELVGLHRDVIDEQSFGTDRGSLMNHKLPKQADYLILYKVTNVAVRESAATQLGRVTTGIVGAGLELGGQRKAAYRTSRSGDIVRLYYATVSAQVQMVETKTGKSIFSYNITADSFPSPLCAQDNIDDCIRKLAEKACARYLYQFGPPVYTTESRNFGQMVQLNIGADYGVVPGMQFRFINKNQAGQEFQIGTGYVQSGVPDDIGPNYSRVVVRGQGKPENFRVMKNMLAKPIMMQ